MKNRRSTWTRCLGLLLALLTLATILASCGGDGNTPADTTGSSVEQSREEGTTEELTNDVADLPDGLDFNQQVFTIRSIVQSPAAKEFESGLNGSIIDQAVYRRNRSLEEDYNCLIMNDEAVGDTNTDQMLTEVEKAVLGDSTDKQIFVSAGYKMCTVAMKGLLRDINTMTYIDREKDYYSQGYNEALSIGESQYLITGRMSMSYYRYMIVMLYNRQMIIDAEVEDPQQIVLDNAWTFERAAQMAEELYQDSDDENLKVYGYMAFVGSGSSMTDGFMSSTGMRVLGKDDDNNYTVELDTVRCSTAVGKILELLYSRGSKSSADCNWNVLLDAFCGGKTAMTTYRLYVVETSEMSKMGNTSTGYGILPLPKMDDSQEDYISYVQDQCFLFGFPKNLSDELTQKVGAFFEAYSSDSYRVVRDVYYEKALTLRYMDQKSAGIMDIIAKNVYIDPVNVYLSSAFKFTTSRLRVIYGDPSTNSIAQILAKYAGETLEKNVADLNETFQDIAAGTLGSKE